MFDENCRAWVLEINEHPSLNITFENEYMNSKKSVDEVISQVDLLVKR